MVIKMGKYFKKVPGERVYLSPMNIDDIEIYTRWLNTPEVMYNIGGAYYNNTIIASREWYEKKFKEERSHLFAIVRADNDVPIGSVEFLELEHIHGTATLAIFIGDEENRGKGFGTEAMRLVLKYGFNVLNLNNICLNVFSFNESAVRSYTKAGFKEYGRRRQAYYLNGVYHDVICMDILREEFYQDEK